MCSHNPRSKASRVAARATPFLLPSIFEVRVNQTRGFRVEVLKLPNEKRPNKAPEPTPVAVMPRATE